MDALGVVRFLHFNDGFFHLQLWSASHGQGILDAVGSKRTESILQRIYESRKEEHLCDWWCRFWLQPPISCWRTLHHTLCIVNRLCFSASSYQIPATSHSSQFPLLRPALRNWSFDSHRFRASSSNSFHLIGKSMLVRLLDYGLSCNARCDRPGSHIFRNSSRDGFLPWPPLYWRPCRYEGSIPKCSRPQPYSYFCNGRKTCTRTESPQRNY